MKLNAQTCLFIELMHQLFNKACARLKTDILSRNTSDTRNPTTKTRYIKGLTMCGPFSINCQRRWWCIIDRVAVNWLVVRKNIFCGIIASYGKSNSSLLAIKHECVHESRLITRVRSERDFCGTWNICWEDRHIFQRLQLYPSYWFQSRFITIFASSCDVTRLTENC